MGKSNIEWTDMVWNPVTGCTKVSPGCQNCYAERMAKRLRGRHGYPSDDPFKVTLHPDRLDEPAKWLNWRKSKIVFVCSMSDLFHDDVPFDFIDKVFNALSWGHAKNLDNKFPILTKRPRRMLKYFQQRDDWFEGKLDERTRLSCFENTWLGVTAENQEQADKRIPILLQIPAAKRFVSIEPMLGGVDIIPYAGGQTHRCKCGWHETELDLLPYGDRWFCIECESYCENYPGIDWAIIGAESGLKRRPCEIELVRDLAGQCVIIKTPLFIKQLHINGKLSKNPAEWPEDLQIQEYPHD